MTADRMRSSTPGEETPNPSVEVTRKGDRLVSGLSPFYFLLTEDLLEGRHALERNSPEERGAHRDFARKESGN